MAIYIRSHKQFAPTKCIRIIDSQMTDDHTEYKIEISIGEFKWTVVKRYSEFYDLHEKIIKEYPVINKEMLPKKKLFGNSSKSFIARRREALQVYLQSLLRSLPNPPATLITFLAFHKYEVHGLTDSLSEELYKRGEGLLASNRFSTLSTLQMFSIGARLMLTEPTCTSDDVKKDTGHIADFVCRLKHLQIIGQPLRYATSDIVPNDLKFNFQHFKSLQTLKLVSCRLPNITIDNHVKKTTKKLIVSKSLNRIKEVLMSGLAWEDCSKLSQPMIDEHSWTSLETVVLRCNKITHIDDSVKLLPNVRKLILCDNRLSDIDNLIHFPFLYFLDLSNNQFTSVHSFYAKLGNISHLNLSYNQIRSLEGFSKLYSLLDLNLSDNNISNATELCHLGQLPFLQALDLRKNPLTSSLDYRLSVLVQFDERFAELSLDGVKTTAKEVELVMVRQVILARKSSKQTDTTTAHAPAYGNPLQTESLHNTPQNMKKNEKPSKKDNNQKVKKSKIESSATATAEASEDRMVGSTAHQATQHTILSPIDSSGVLTASETTSSQTTQDTLVNSQNAHKFTAYKLGHQTFSSNKRKSSVKKRKRYLILPETLPNHTDKSLLTTIQSVLASVVLKGGLKQFDLKQEAACCIAWCSVVFSDSSTKEPEGDLPCCVCLTAHSFHLLRVEVLRGDAGIPKMKHLTSIRFSDIQCFLLGARKTYVRLILKDQPFLVFITFSASKTEHLLSQIKKAYRRSVPELDEYKDPLVFDGGAGCEGKLMKSILSFENNSIESDLHHSLPSIHLKASFLQLVQPITDHTEPQQGCTHVLVATTHNMYVIKHDFTYAPADVTPIQFTNTQSDSTRVSSVFPIAGKIVSIQFYDVDSLDHQLATYLNHSKLSGLPHNEDFIGYGIRITFHLGIYAIQTLDLRWPTSNLRDTFLTWFVETRNELRESSAPPKQASKTHTLEGHNVSDDEVNYPSPTHNNDFLVSNMPHEPRSKSPPSLQSSDSSSSESPPVPLLGTPQATITQPSSFSASDASNDLRNSSPRNTHHPANGFCLSLHENLDNSFKESYADFEEDVLAEFDCIPVKTLSGTEVLAEDEYKQVDNFKVEVRRLPHTIQLSDILSSVSESTAPKPKYQHISEEYLSSPKDSSHPFVLFPSLRDISTDLNQLDLFMARHVVRRPGESLRHLCVAAVSFYDHPHIQIPSCILLTNYSIHFFSNLDPSLTDYSHVYSRTRPHSLCVVNSNNPDISLSLNNFNKPLLKRIACIHLHELWQVDLGMFAQSIRFAVHEDRSKVLACLTRDARATQALMQQLLKCLSSEHPLCMLSPKQEEGDDCNVYNMFANCKDQDSTDEFVFNFVRFFYPSHEHLTDLSFIVSFSTQLDDPQHHSEVHNFKKAKFLSYLSCFVLESRKGCQYSNAYIPLRPECLVVSRDKVTLVTEDHVSFPLPDFVTFPPDSRQFEFKRSFNMSDLSQLVRYDEDACILKMVFENLDGGQVDDEDEIDVDISFKHFDGEVRESEEKKKMISVVLHVSNPRDVDQVVQQMTESNLSTSLSTLPSFDF